MRIDLGHDEPPEIGLIALIDCIFFLLMFFMVATSFRQDKPNRPQKELPVVLPAAQASLDAVRAAAAPLVLAEIHAAPRSIAGVSQPSFVRGRGRKSAIPTMQFHFWHSKQTRFFRGNK
jgi:biopolymer transport protein ExbD